MKVILIGASGTIGKEAHKALSEAGHEIIRAGRSSGDLRVDIADRESVRALYRDAGAFDALVNASGDVAFAPLADLTADQWDQTISSKLLGQIQLVQEGLPYVNERGSFTLVSGILGQVPIAAGIAATIVNRALEGFVMAAATELPKNARINLVSPTVLAESMGAYGPFFPGFIPVEGWKVGQAYKRSVMGVQTGQVFRVE